jgi:hypothetical protein
MIIRNWSIFFWCFDLSLVILFYSYRNPIDLTKHTAMYLFIPSRSYRILLYFCLCPCLIRHFGGVTQAVCALSSAYH